MLALFLALLIPLSADASVTKAEGMALFERFQEVFPGREIDFNPPLFGTAQNAFDLMHYFAFYHREGERHVINIYGGVIALEPLTVDGLATIVCHEIGHGFGGAPYKLNGMTTEGQADYYATSECLPKILPAIPAQTPAPLANEESLLCEQGDALCLRSLQAIRDGLLVLFHPTDHGRTKLLDTDTSVVTEIDKSDDYYPTPACRARTLLNGALGRPRPACWFPVK